MPCPARVADGAIRGAIVGSLWAFFDPRATHDARSASMCYGVGELALLCGFGSCSSSLDSWALYWRELHIADVVCARQLDARRFFRCHHGRFIGASDGANLT